MKHNEHLTIQEAARIKKVSKESIRRCIRTGKLRSPKKGYVSKDSFFANYKPGEKSEFAATNAWSKRDNWRGNIETKRTFKGEFPKSRKSPNRHSS